MERTSAKKKRGGVDFKYPNIYVLGFSETAEAVDRKSIYKIMTLINNDLKKK